MELTIATEVITLIITLLGSLGATMPFIAKYKLKLSQVKALVISVDAALNDNKITPIEAKQITRYARELLGTAKI